ncbi:MAG: helix-turn-helix transcriptional regulator [Xanthobacteraceae bacterium]
MIKLAREIRGMSLRELETETGISNALLSQIETGAVKSPSFANVVRICEALNVPIEHATKLVSLREFKQILRQGKVRP